MIPSVILRVDIPNAVEDSWYRGQTYVGLKEHCFEPSSPLRYATELDQVVRDDHNPILAIYTYGGPDHRTNLLSVQFALICIFLQEDGDMVFAVRTPPYNSWKDRAEWVMSVLNLGTQAVGLVRSSTDIEGVLLSCSGLKKIRSLNEDNPAFEVKAKILESVQPCKVLLADVFRRMTYSKIPLQIFEPATSESIDNLWSQMSKIEFYEKHYRDRNYHFSVILVVLLFKILTSTNLMSFVMYTSE